MTIYIAYGSNTNLEQMQFRCPNSKLIGSSILEDYKLTFRGKGHANIEKFIGGKVPIVLWHIDLECEKNLDIYEDYPNYYLKHYIDFKFAGKIERGLVYIMKKELGDRKVRPSQDYLNTIRQGYIENGLEIEYLKYYLEKDL